MSGATNGAGRAALRGFAFLLRLYPRSFRARFGHAMSETFAEELADARRRGPIAVVVLWVRAALRIPVLALAEHVSMRRGRARGRFGRPARRARNPRDAFLGPSAQDVRIAIRSLARAPGFVAVTVLTIGLGAGATTTLLGVMNALLYRPLPVASPDRLVRVEEQRDGDVSTGMEGVMLPYARYRAYGESTRDVFSGLAAQRLQYFSMRAEGPAFPVAAAVSSGNYFDVLGVRPAAGRFFSSDDEPVVVLSHWLWQQRFDGSPDVIGRSIHLNGYVMTIVGVAAREFGGTVGFLSVDLWVPYGAHDAAAWPDARVNLFGRLRSTPNPREGTPSARRPAKERTRDPLIAAMLLTGESQGRNWHARRDGPPVNASLNTVDAGYFETLRIPLVVGRGIDEIDVRGAPNAIVINQTFARRLWPDENPIGKVVLNDDDRYEVVGVTRDGKYADFGEERKAFAFLSAAQRYSSKQVLHVRVRAGTPAAEVMAAIRNEVTALDANVALERATPLPAAVGLMLFPQRFAASLIAVFGVIGLVLGGIGVFGLLAQNVAQRSRELGIRMALGADTRSVLRLVLRQAAWIAVAGGAAGLTAAAALTRFLGGLLHGLSPLDPITFTSVPLVLGVVALMASYVPTRRALRVDPMDVLRQE